MSDALEPPAKRQRLDLDAPSNGASGLDVPSSPVDDMDDDFYEADPVKPEPSAVNPEAPSSLATAVPAPSSLPTLPIPGLGLLGAPSAQQDPAQNEPGPSADGNDAEDGEVSDPEAFYNDGEPAQAQPAPQLLHANGTESSQDVVTDVTATNIGSGELVTNKSLTDRAACDIEHNPVAASSTAADGKDAQENSGKADFLRAAEANKGNNGAEWQLDSEASSDSSSDSSSDDNSDEDSSEDGELLDPEEQVRRLMEETADDPGASGKARVKTTNEVEEQYEKPDINVTEDTKITELGKIESVVDNLVLIKANVSGDHQVLEAGSALCLANRTIIGKISETLGRVEEPRYALGFADAAEIPTFGITKDTLVYYVNEHSTFVFTEPLRTQKHTDASNLHDEEANDVEFSDDEKEAEFKRQQKEKKRSRAEAHREPDEKKKQPSGHADAPATAQTGYYQGGGLKYSDDEDEDLGMYKPLARPDHFEDIVGAGAPIEDRSHVRRGMMRGGRGGWMDRGRGFRSRGGGGGGRGDRGRGDRGGRFGRGQSEKHGRHNDNRQRNGPHQENRSASSASPGRSNRGRQQQQQQQQQRSPPRGNSSNNRRQNKHASPAPKPRSQRAESINANANAYAQNNAVNSTGWSASYPNATQPATSHAPVVPAAAPAGSYGYQQPNAPQQDQQNAMAWMQWFQSAAAMMAQNQGQPQAQPAQLQAQPQAPPPSQPANQYQYQQYQHNAAPSANTQPNNSQAGNASLQDILRALGGGSGP